MVKVRCWEEQPVLALVLEAVGGHVAGPDTEKDTGGGVTLHLSLAPMPNLAFSFLPFGDTGDRSQGFTCRAIVL